MKDNESVEEKNLKAMYRQWKLGLLNEYERKQMICIAWEILIEKGDLI